MHFNADGFPHGPSRIHNAYRYRFRIPGIHGPHHLERRSIPVDEELGSWLFDQRTFPPIQYPLFPADSASSLGLGLLDPPTAPSFRHER
jgi:hypothetical protein